MTRPSEDPIDALLAGEAEREQKLAAKARPASARDRRRPGSNQGREGTVEARSMTPEQELIAELYAAEVCYRLAEITKAQHRISCALAGDHGPRVVAHLRSLGIAESAASAFVDTPLTVKQMQDVSQLMEQINGWRPHLAQQIAALSVARRS
jgi:hypothetical protein